FTNVNSASSNRSSICVLKSTKPKRWHRWQKLPIPTISATCRNALGPCAAHKRGERLPDGRYIRLPPGASGQWGGRWPQHVGRSSPTGRPARPGELAVAPGHGDAAGDRDAESSG